MERYEARTLNSVEEALAHVRELGVPTKIDASYVLGGWSRKPENESQVARLVAEGLRASPIGTVMLCWVIQ